MPSKINCLFSHKCNERAHSIGKQLHISLANFAINLQIDPFDAGDDVYVRMQTFDIEAVLLLLEPLSLSSKPVQLELESASRQGLPIFVAHVEGEVPETFKTRSFWHVPPLDSQHFSPEAAMLAEPIRRRVLFNRKIRSLNPDEYFHAMSEVAKEIAMEENRTIIAEFACELARRYCRVSDPTTRYWLAIALGRADTPEAMRLLDALPNPSHPLETEGIREAREIVNHEKRLSQTSYSSILK